MTKRFYLKDFWFINNFEKVLFLFESREYLKDVEDAETPGLFRS